VEWTFVVGVAMADVEADALDEGVRDDEEVDSGVDSM